MNKQDKIDDGWIEVTQQDVDREVTKLGENENIEGLLMGRRSSHDFGYVYYIKVKDDPLEKVICGTVKLNQLLLLVEDGTEIIIERMKNVKTEKGRDMHDFKIYKKEEEEC